jgi:plastocyanin
MSTIQKNTLTIVIIVTVVMVFGLGYYFFNTMRASAPQSNIVAPVAETTAVPPEQTLNVAIAPNTVTVRYTSSGFSPKDVTIAKGDTVTSVADPQSDEMWVSSNPHPTHEGYDGTTRREHCVAGYAGPAPFDECSVGTSFSFTFMKSGTWHYHNHGNSGDGGTVIVK